MVQPFVAWQKSFPFLAGRAHPALRAVEMLTEFLADDAVRTRLGDDSWPKPSTSWPRCITTWRARTRLATPRDLADAVTSPTGDLADP